MGSSSNRENIEPLDLKEQAILRTELLRQSTHSAELRFFHRLHCVLLVESGLNCSEIASIFGENSRTIGLWVDHFKQMGLDGLKEKNKAGRPRKCSHEQLQRLQQDLHQHPRTFAYNESHWNGVVLQQHLKQHYQIILSRRQCQRLLKKFQDE